MWDARGDGWRNIAISLIEAEQRDHKAPPEPQQSLTDIYRTPNEA